MTEMVEIGMTRDALTSSLGSPDDVIESSLPQEQEYLHYTNPHNLRRSILVAISKEQKVIYVAHEGPLPACLQVKDANAHEIMEKYGTSREVPNRRTKE